ncbi:MAG: FAD:protein FMN transferase [Pseudomonadales bacterium]|nr:FAD:protein FMN transferase [Pseudomonadales bacterium]
MQLNIKKILFSVLLGLIVMGLGVAALQNKKDGSQTEAYSSQPASNPFAAAPPSDNPADFQVYSLSGPTMGTSYNIKLVLPAYRANEIKSFALGVKAVLAKVETQMSTYQSTSELSQFNDSFKGEWVVVSKPLYKVISAAQSLSSRSQGAFDITVGPLVNLWGFGPSHHLDQVPSAFALKEAFDRVGYNKLLLDAEKSALKKEADLYLDLSAIAKGYGVDKVLEFLVSKGLENVLVEVGGEIRAIGLKPNGSTWRIAIESPLSNTRAIQKVINIRDMALATSGDYRNYFEKAGRRYSHTINPRTGKPIAHKLASVTVLHENCMMADGLATMFMVMGPEPALQFANKNNLAIFMLVKSEGGFTEFSSRAFSQLFDDK